MIMYKVGICGHFAVGKDLMNGQVDKTVSVYKALADQLGEENVTTLDTCGWEKHPAKLTAQCSKLLRECENIIMMPSKKGVMVFPALFNALRFNGKTKLHYIVIGGWLPEKIERHPSLLRSLGKLDNIFVELPAMADKLRSLGLSSVKYMPNFRETAALAPEELVTPEAEPYRLCTFSRIMASKGIDKAVDAVRIVNREVGRVAYRLDIYGVPEPDYAETFKKMAAGFEPYIKYNGFLRGFGRSSRELKSCFALLFPTTYDGEGFAGTIIDSFAAGVPVIATDWRYNSQAIRDGVDGILYDHKDQEMLPSILKNLLEDPEKLNKMRPTCLERASEFDTKNAVNILIKEL